MTEEPKADRKLVLNFHGRVIEHLGLQMYQSPTAALAELISNAWDADASIVAITLPVALEAGARIEICDDGNGMTFEEVRDRYLKVGSNRRGGNTTQRSARFNRIVLGRKGIGKFAGFGIAKRISVKTISRDTGEQTEFILDYDRIRGESDEYVDTSPLEIEDVKYEPPDETRKVSHGTVVTLEDLSIGRTIPGDQFRRSMGRRFSLSSTMSAFAIQVDGVEVPRDEDLRSVEFSFPRDYTDAERPTGMTLDGEWGDETLADGHTIRWRYRFYKTPIAEKDLAGVAVFVAGKVAQVPFLFELGGTLSGRHGTAYLTGRVDADYLDALERDVISPERQRIDWEAPEASALLEWGQTRTKALMDIWRSRRGAERERRLSARLGPMQGRLERMSAPEKRTVNKVLRALANVESLDDEHYLELANSLVSAWEAGRLKDLIHTLADQAELDEAAILRILTEANVVTQLQIAEVLRTKLEIVRELRRRVQDRQLENPLRDFIAEHPYLIAPRWNTFAKERRVDHVLADAARASGLDGDADYEGRVDLVLSSGDTLLVLEFMRPGLRLDFNHVDRFDRYMSEIRVSAGRLTASPFRRVIGYLIADSRTTSGALDDRIRRMEKDEQYAMDWRYLFAQAEEQWREWIDLVAEQDRTAVEGRDILPDPSTSSG